MGNDLTPGETNARAARDGVVRDVQDDRERSAPPAVHLEPGESNDRASRDGLVDAQASVPAEDEPEPKDPERPARKRR